MSFFPQFHRLGKVLWADFEARFESVVNVSMKRGVQVSQNLTWTLNSDGEKGTDQAGTIAEEGHPFAHHVLDFIMAADEGDQSSIERGRVHVADISGDE